MLAETDVLAVESGLVDVATGVEVADAVERAAGLDAGGVWDGDDPPEQATKAALMNTPRQVRSGTLFMAP